MNKSMACDAGVKIKGFLSNYPPIEDAALRGNRPTSSCKKMHELTNPSAKVVFYLFIF